MKTKHYLITILLISVSCTMVYFKTYEFAFKKGYEKGHSEGYSEGCKLSEEHNKQIKNTFEAINDWEKNNLSSY